MNVLVLAPHPDDEAIGCGGAILNHGDRRDRVTTAFLTSGELGLKSLPAVEAQRIREAEAKAAAAILKTASTTFLRLPDWGVAEHIDAAATALRPILESLRPTLVYLPHPGDDHPDHRACLPALQLALMSIPGLVPELRGYEVWTPMPSWDLAEDISGVMPRKLAAVGAYRTQLDQFRYDRAVSGLNQYRGALAGRCEFAEAFVRLHTDGERLTGH